METAASAEPGTKEVTYSESESDNAMEGTVGGTGEEASLGASGSSGAEWSGAEDDYHFVFYRAGSNGGYKT